MVFESKWTQLWHYACGPTEDPASFKVRNNLGHRAASTHASWHQHHQFSSRENLILMPASVKSFGRRRKVGPLTFLLSSSKLFILVGVWNDGLSMTSCLPRFCVFVVRNSGMSKRGDCEIANAPFSLQSEFSVKECDRKTEKA